MYIDLFVGEGGMVRVYAYQYLKMDLIVLRRICFLHFSVIWLYFFIMKKIQAKDGEFEAENGYLDCLGEEVVSG